EDRRGMGGGAKVGGAGLLIAVVLSLVFGRDFVSGLVGTTGTGESTGGGELETSAAEEELVDFMAAMLQDQEATWTSLLGDRYAHAPLVIYRRGTNSGCGYGSSAMGPFYCPADRKVYLDLAFFEDLDRQLGAGGDFAQA